MSVTLLIAAALTGAADPAPTMDDALLALRQEDARVAAVAYRLATANTELCPEKGPQSGLLLQDALQYGPEVRPIAMRDFGLGGAPSVEAVAPGSPAQAAGLQPGDMLLSVDDARFYLVPPPEKAPASEAALNAERRLLDAALSRGPATISFLRAGKAMTAKVDPVQGCAYRFELYPSPKREASSDGSTVMVSSALTRYADRDEDLAVILGHEMAHNVLHHVQHPTGTSHSRERAADYVGAYLAARAGYDISGAPDFWRRFGEDNWGADLGFLTHPSPTSRSRALAAVAAEIAAKKAAGQPLAPASAPPR